MEFLVIDDNKPRRNASGALIENEGHGATLFTTARAAQAIPAEAKFDMVLLNENLKQKKEVGALEHLLKNHPDLPVVLFTGRGAFKAAVEAMRSGVVDCLENPFTRQQLQKLLLRPVKDQRKDRKKESGRGNGPRNTPPTLDFTSPGLRAVMEVVSRVAKTWASVLITGESGTGKSVLARALHAQSHLADQPFVVVNCPSLSPELLQSELFGHVRGAFTGAIKDHWGKVNAAERGTLFFDEIGDLPLEIQSKLLRLLQEREYERLGENVTRHSNLRIVAATNRDLKKRVAEGTFREDLYFRLDVITLNMPPLRARPDDVLSLARQFLQHFSTQCGRELPEFSEGAIGQLLGYSWPGNLRELRNAVERAVILAKGDRVAAEDMPGDLNGSLINEPDRCRTGAMVSLQRLGALHMRRVIARTSTLREAAGVLGIDPTTLARRYRKITQVEMPVRPGTIVDLSAHRRSAAFVASEAFTSQMSSQ